MKRFIISLMILLLGCAAFAQSSQKTIKGIVTDQTDEPLIGVAVVVPGTTVGVVTDERGQYTIKVDASVQSLEFSSMGFMTQTVKIGNKAILDVQLAEMVNQLDEVIAIGYTTTTKANATGSVQNMSVADQAMRVVSSTDMLLQGKAAGVQMIQNSGQPGSDEMEIRIRGISSIDNNSAPLVIVDGVEGDISRVNSRDIKSVTVLKDASSAAIYGNRAAAGVIVIETKTGQKGIEINYTNSASLQKATSLPDVIGDPLLYIDLANEAWRNSTNGATYKFSLSDRDKWQNRSDASHQPTDWKPFIYKTGFMQNHHVVASGAGERYDFSFSTGYQDQKGVVFSTSANKLDYRIKMNLYFFNKKLKLGANISGFEKKSHEAQSATTIINRYMSNRPILFAKTDKAGEVMYGAGAAAYAIEELGGGNDYTYSDLSSSYTATYTPIKQLTLKAVYNVRNNRSHTSNFTPQYEIAGSVELNSKSVYRSTLTDRSDWSGRSSLSVTANYKDKWGKLKYDLLAGYEMRETHSNWTSTQIYDLMKNARVISYGDPNTLSVKSAGSEYAALSAFGRMFFDFDSRYLLEFNARYDGSSRFLKGRRFGWFPSASAAWRVSNEKFMKNVKWVDNLKFRVSVGRLGNDNISNYYAYADQLSSSAYYSFGGTIVNGVAYSMFANKMTTWEKVDQIDLGFDFDFLKSFSLSVDVYDKVVKDMLSTIYPVISLGTTTNGAAQNIGSMRNRGFEVTANWNKQIAKNCFLSLGGNIGYVENTVLDLGPNQEQWHDTAGNLRSAVGYPTRSRWGYRYIGLYQLDDFTWQSDSDPNIPHMDRLYVLKPGRTTTSLHQNPRPGDLIIEDQDGDNNITPNDMVYLGRARSNLTFGFNISFSWKNFDFQALAQGQGYALAYLQDYGPYTTAFTGQIETKFIEQRWTELTPEYRCLFADKERAAIISTYDMHNAAFVRLKNLQFGYTFKGEWLRAAKIRDFRIYVSGENLLTLSHFPKGYDPERSVSNTSVTSYPIIKSFSTGLSLTF